MLLHRVVVTRRGSADALSSRSTLRWQGVLDGVLRSMNAPGLSDVARLAPKVVELSRAYNTAQAEATRRAASRP